MFAFALKILNSLNSGISPWQLAWGMSFGMMFGLTPFFDPVFGAHSFIILLIVMSFQTNFGMFLVATMLFTSFSYVLDPYFHDVGMALLTNESLQGLWTALYNNDLARVFNFNNSILLGSFVVSVIAFFPSMFVFKWLVVWYRANILPKIEKWHFVKVMRASSVFTLFMGK